MGRRPERTSRLFLRAVALAVALLLVPRGLRAEVTSRVAIYFEGKGASPERSSIVAALPERVHVAGAKETDTAIRKAGLHGKIATIVGSEDRRKRAAKALGKVAKALDVDAVIVGSAPERKGDRDVPVLVVRRGGETDFDTVDFLSKDSDKARAEKWASFLAVVLPEPVAEPETPSHADEPDAEAPPPARAPLERRESVEPDRGAQAKASKDEPPRLSHALAVVGVAYDAGYRSFSYKDPVTGNLRPYDVGGTPGLQVTTEIYPLARSAIAVLSDVGVVGRFASAFSFDSGTTDGKSAKTTWHDVELGLRYRIRAGTGESAPILGLSGTYASSVFEFDGAGAAADELPGARYQMLRAGLDGRLPVGPIAVLVQASYLQVLGVSPMSTRFPRESVRGIGARIGAAMPLLPWLEARLEAGYDRLFFSFHPEPGDAFVAGGALDQRLSMTAGAFVVF